MKYQVLVDRLLFWISPEVQFGDPINIYWVEGPKRKGLITVTYGGLGADAWIEKDPDSGLRILMMSS